MRLCVTKNLTQIPVYDSITYKETRVIKRFFLEVGLATRLERGTHKPEVNGSIPLPATISFFIIHDPILYEIKF